MKPKNDIDVHRVRVFSLITCSALLLFLVYRFVTGHMPVFFLILGSSCIAGTGLVFSLRGERPRLTAHLTFIGASLSVGGTQIQDGRIESTSLWVLSVVPFVAGHILGTRAIAGYTLLAACFINFAMWGESLGFVPPEQFQPSTFSWMVLRVVPLLCLAAVGIQMARDNRARVRSAAEKMLESEQAHRRALELDAEKAIFLEQMSNEIRSPIVGIKGISQHWRELAAAPEPRDSVRVIDRCADRLLGMIQDIQDISKIECGEIPISRAPFSINLAISDVARLFRARAAAKGLSLQVQGPTHAHWVQGDAQRLVQVLSNLVGNAIKFSDQGEVLIRWDQTQDGRYTFDIVDQGIGMTPEQLEHLFERYNQVNLDQGVLRGGSGLGLTISKALSEAMGGELVATSQKGLGSKFTLTLNLETTSESTLEEGNAQTATQHATGASILVLDKDETSFFVLQLNLRSFGGQPTRCTNLAQALEQAKSQAFDCIIVDLPSLDGQDINCIQNIRKACSPNATTPAIATSIDGSAETRRKCLEAGFTELLVKPFPNHALAHVIELATQQVPRPKEAA